ncbi:uncharacterized protein PG986_008428 [Apiospora aurea]|uniref:Uncharacterized protein n=1 Tax=Apiospora aurea TaxID=335848 RepID=A0ABR1QFE8_9PEZI
MGNKRMSLGYGIRRPILLRISKSKLRLHVSLIIKTLQSLPQIAFLCLFSPTSLPGTCDWHKALQQVLSRPVPPPQHDIKQVDGLRRHRSRLMVQMAEATQKIQVVVRIHRQPTPIPVERQDRVNHEIKQLDAHTYDAAVFDSVAPLVEGLRFPPWSKRRSRQGPSQANDSVWMKVERPFGTSSQTRSSGVATTEGKKIRTRRPDYVDLCPVEVSTTAHLEKMEVDKDDR